MSELTFRVKLITELGFENWATETSGIWNFIWYFEFIRENGNRVLWMMDRRDGERGKYRGWFKSTVWISGYLGRRRVTLPRIRRHRPPTPRFLQTQPFRICSFYILRVIYDFFLLGEFRYSLFTGLIRKRNTEYCLTSDLF